MIVRSPEEILATLDADGALDGLPFMPEMLGWCGKSCRVERRVEKTCVDIAPPAYSTRRFAGADVVVLEGSRCDGHGHDGCDRNCKIFWKVDWLRPADGSNTPTRISEAGLDALRRRLRVKSDDDRYFCQSTELHRATEAFPGKVKPWLVRILFREIRNGDRSVPEILELFVLWFAQRLRRVVSGQEWLRGPHQRTPSETLNLKPGDFVRIKNYSQIVETLDHRRCNRGMPICLEMTKYCGGDAEVRVRVDRIIDEKTGKMHEMRNTVILQNLRCKWMRGEPGCLCYNKLGDCPRGEQMFWREIWLERDS